MMENNRKRQKISNVVLPNLPEEIWCFIFSYLPTESRRKATAICKLWFKLIRSDPKLSGHISVSLSGIQNENWNWENWPSLKTIEIYNKTLFCEWQTASSKRAMETMKEFNFKNCPNLEKVILCVKFDLAELSTNAIITEGIWTVCQLVFNPKVDLNSFNMEHLQKLKIYTNAFLIPYYENPKERLKTMKMIEETAKNLKCLDVWDKFNGSDCLYLHHGPSMMLQGKTPWKDPEGSMQLFCSCFTWKDPS